jgi:flagellar motor switch protein FliM
VAVIVFFEILIRDLTYPLNICFPYFVLEPVMSKLTGQSWIAQTQRKTPQDASVILSEKIVQTKTPLIVKLGQKEITLHQLVSMECGDIITLDTKVQDNLQVIIKDKIKYFGQPGNLGKRKAVKIIRSLDKDEEKLYE